MIDLKIDESFRDLIPPLDEADFNELEQSVLSEGIREPICVWKDTIVDGHHRYQLAKKHNLEIQIKKMSFEDADEAKIWILGNQLSRRNVTPFVKAELELKRAVLYEARALLINKMIDKTTKLSMPKISPDKRKEMAKAAGVSHGYIQAVNRIKNSELVDEKILSKLRSGELPVAKILKEIKRAERKEEAEKRWQLSANYKPNKDIQIVHDDFYKWCADNLEDHSIDLILTDPPYPKEYLYLWEQLGEVAKRVLKVGGKNTDEKGGYLIAYSGQQYLDVVMNLLSKNLSYTWTIGLKHSGPTQLINARNLVCGWKPILVYRNGIPGNIHSWTGSALVDFIDDDYREKEFHDWGQGKSAVGYLMRTFSKPNDLVLDPFVGGGTTLVVAAQLRRRCIGIEIDKKQINKIKTNLMENDQTRLFGLTNGK